MKVSAILLAAASVAYAAPKEGRSYNASNMIVRHLEARDDRCDKPTHFIDETSDMSPTLSSCQRLYDSIKGGGGPMHLDRGGWKKLLSDPDDKGCVFGARRLDTGHIVVIDRKDVADLFGAALNGNYGGEERGEEVLGIRGEFKCDSAAGKQKAQFSISHRDDWGDDGGRTNAVEACEDKEMGDFCEYNGFDGGGLGRPIVRGECVPASEDNNGGRFPFCKG